MTNKRRLLTQLVSCFTIRGRATANHSHGLSNANFGWMKSAKFSQQSGSNPHWNDCLWTDFGNVFAWSTDTSPPHSLKHLDYQTFSFILVSSVVAWTFPNFLQTQTLELIQTSCIVLISRLQITDIQHSPLTPVSCSVTIATTWKLHPFRCLISVFSNSRSADYWTLSDHCCRHQPVTRRWMEMLHLYCCIKVGERLAAPATSTS